MFLDRTEEELIVWDRNCPKNHCMYKPRGMTLRFAKTTRLRFLTNTVELYCDIGTLYVQNKFLIQQRKSAHSCNFEMIGSVEDNVEKSRLDDSQLLIRTEISNGWPGLVK